MLFDQSDFRGLRLETQGLNHKNSFGTGKDGVSNTIQHLGYIQIDSISVINYAHDHVLWSRIPEYEPSILKDLLAERKVFEYWFHAASYLPIQDFRFSLHRKKMVKNGNVPHLRLDDNEFTKYVYDKIRVEGPLRSRDFKDDQQSKNGWWNFKPAKKVLEYLFMSGELMVAERSGIEKVFDLTERVLPDTIDLSEPTDEEYAKYLVDTHLRAYGFVTIKQVTYLRPKKNLINHVKDYLESLIGKNELLKLSHNKNEIYVKSEEFNLKAHSKSFSILSPFDNAIIHRDQLKEFFEFDFTLECYLPKSKRKYGYFSLPLLYGTEFVGRIDCVANRKSSELEVAGFSLEKNQDISNWKAHFKTTLLSFADFNNCSSVTFNKDLSTSDKSLLNKLLS